MNRSFRRVVKHKRPKLQVKNPRLAPVLDIFENDESAIYLTGSPGYRVARSRSGLGYLETRAEWARIQGLMLKWLVTGKFKTRNPAYLFFISLLGIYWASPTPLILYALFTWSSFSKQWDSATLQNFLFFTFQYIPFDILGILLLVNVVLSLIKCDQGESITGD